MRDLNEIARLSELDLQDPLRKMYEAAYVLSGPSKSFWSTFAEKVEKVLQGHQVSRTVGDQAFKPVVIENFTVRACSEWYFRTVLVPHGETVKKDHHGITAEIAKLVLEGLARHVAALPEKLQGDGLQTCVYPSP
jgi:hypothetical protein